MTQAVTGGYPDNNPKTVLGAKKVPLHLVPPAAKHGLAEALADGAKKYGPYNWRNFPISASVYYAAAQRHMDAWWDGEDLAPDSQVHHLKHAMACMALVLDSLELGLLNDDRPVKGATPRLQAEYAAGKKGSAVSADQLSAFVASAFLSEQAGELAGQISDSIEKFYAESQVAGDKSADPRHCPVPMDDEDHTPYIPKMPRPCEGFCGSASNPLHHAALEADAVSERMEAHRALVKADLGAYIRRDKSQGRVELEAEEPPMVAARLLPALPGRP